jgi:hypothetical protein
MLILDYHCVSKCSANHSRRSSEWLLLVPMQPHNMDYLPVVIDGLTVVDPFGTQLE